MNGDYAISRGSESPTLDSPLMLDYCSNNTDTPTSSTGYHNHSQSPPSMASILNAAGGANQGGMDSVSRQSAFVLSNPPLAALHNMTEMKVPSSGVLTQPYSQTSLKPYLTAAQSMFNHHGITHGITDILSRPANAFGQLGVGIPRLSTTGMYSFGPQSARFPKPISELPGRPPIYWPGVLQSSGAWRPQSGTYPQHTQTSPAGTVITDPPQPPHRP